jgi:hypothetical protein
MPDRLQSAWDWVLDNYPTLSAAVGGAAAAIGWWIKRGVSRWRRFLAAIDAANSIHQEFGTAGGKAIREILTSMNDRVSIQALELRVKERRAGIAMYVCDPDGQCTEGSLLLAEWWGMSESELRGYGWTKPVKDGRRVYENWKFSVANNLPYRESYTVAPCNGGAEFDVETEAFPVLAGDKKTVLCYVGYVAKRVAQP